MLTGLDKIVYGVEELSKCVEFFQDWGLTLVEQSETSAMFQTQDGCEIELRSSEDPSLPEAIEQGSTVRRVIWGVREQSDLNELEAKLPELKTGPDGPELTDPNGMTISFRKTRRQEIELQGSPCNTVDQNFRINQRSQVYDTARPYKIGHVVFFVPEIMDCVNFYVDRLGFVISDCYPNAGYFLRCGPEGGHHDLFLLQTPDRKRGLNHVSYTVRDIHEVFGGGLSFDRKGWKTQLGPGRHPISSAYFWYFHCPAGASVEYFADEDYCTADWEPREWERTPGNFAEWAVPQGLDGNTRRVRQDSQHA